jgi:hypothetical protein
LSREVSVRLLKIVNTVGRDASVGAVSIIDYQQIVINDIDALESFCLVGGIPVIIVSSTPGREAQQLTFPQPFTSKKYSLDCRLEASIFIQQLTGSALTLQMLIS